MGSPQVLAPEGEEEAPPEKLNFPSRKMIRQKARADEVQHLGKKEYNTSSAADGGTFPSRGRL